MQGPWLEEARFLQLRVKAGSSGVVIDNIAEMVMPFGPVAPSRADQAMIPVFVHDALAQRAGRLVRENGGTQPSKDAGSEEKGVHVVAGVWGRQGVEPGAGVGGGRELQVRATGGVRGGFGFEVVQGLVVNTS